VWNATTRTAIARLDCSATALATGPFGPETSLLIVVREDGGMSFWSINGNRSA